MTKDPTIPETWEERFDKRFNCAIVEDAYPEPMPEPMNYDIKQFIANELSTQAQLHDQEMREQRKTIEQMILGELRRSELQAVVESQARAVGHTHAAIHGVKDSHNAMLVISHNSQRQNVDLPKEKTVTLEEVKRGFLMGRQKAIVMDNYALFEVARDIIARVEHVFKQLTTNSVEKEA